MLNDSWFIILIFVADIQEQLLLFYTNFLVFIKLTDLQEQN